MNLGTESEPKLPSFTMETGMLISSSPNTPGRAPAMEALSLSVMPKTSFKKSAALRHRTNESTSVRIPARKRTRSDVNPFIKP